MPPLGPENLAPPSGAPEPKRLRLFVAVDLPHDVRRLLVDTIEALKHAAGADAVRWVRPDGIHLTLKFLGATAEDRVPLIHTALRLGVGDSEPFDVTPIGVGSFGGSRNLRVIWVGLGGDGGALADLAERVERALAPLGFPKEDRAFNAHLTLGRVRDTAGRDDRARVHDALTHFAAPLYPAFRVDRVSLIESVLGPGGAAYRQLGAYPLRGVPQGEAS